MGPPLHYSSFTIVYSLFAIVLTGVLQCIYQPGDVLGDGVVIQRIGVYLKVVLYQGHPLALLAALFTDPVFVYFFLNWLRYISISSLAMLVAPM